MKGKAVTTGLLLGALTSMPVALVTYAADAAAGLPFVPFVLFDFLVRVLPGFILVPSIGLMAKTLLAFHVASLSAAAKTAEQTMALVVFVVASAVTGAILAAAARALKRVRPAGQGALIGVLAAILYVAMLYRVGFPPAGPLWSVVWLVALFAAWWSLVGWQLGVTTLAQPATAEQGAARNRAYHLWGTTAAALLSVLVALAIALAPRPSPRPPTPVQPAKPLADASSSQPVPSPETAVPARIEPAPGTRPEITDTKDFYRIDIDTLPPRVDAAKWRLEVAGLVEHPMTLSLDDIRSRAGVSQYATMSCISNPVGGPLISTGLWTGVPLMSILNEAGIKPDAIGVAVSAVDGYYETVSAKDMNDPRTLLVYNLNNEPLSHEQGFPLRLFIPGHYGMKQPKWITRIEAIGSDGTGYWVDRGWDRDAFVQTTSAIDTVATKKPDPKTGAIPIGGIAYAGDRGISKVEVQIDSGPWVEAKLRAPALSPLTWVQWRYDWPPGATGRHSVRVRAYDGAGAMQTPQQHDEFPAGATGYHEVEFRL